MMNENVITVTSTCNATVVINEPELQLKKTWQKEGAKQLIERDLLVRAFYSPSVEFLFRQGILTTTDKEFLREAGLLDEKEEPIVVQTSQTYFNRLIKFMPLDEFKKEIAKLTKTQIDELADYAIDHYADLKMDRIDFLSQVSDKNILNAIQNYKSSQEE